MSSNPTQNNPNPNMQQQQQSSNGEPAVTWLDELEEYFTTLGPRGEQSKAWKITGNSLKNQQTAAQAALAEERARLAYAEQINRVYSTTAEPEPTEPSVQVKNSTEPTPCGNLNCGYCCPGTGQHFVGNTSSGMNTAEADNNWYYERWLESGPLRTYWKDDEDYGLDLPDVLAEGLSEGGTTNGDVHENTSAQSLSNFFGQNPSVISEAKAPEDEIQIKEEKLVQSPKDRASGRKHHRPNPAPQPQPGSSTATDASASTRPTRMKHIIQEILAEGICDGKTIFLVKWKQNILKKSQIAYQEKKGFGITEKVDNGDGTFTVTWEDTTEWEKDVINTMAWHKYQTIKKMRESDE